MNQPMLTTQTIAILTTLAEERSFTLAAEKLGITQSAVSRAVAQLERTLGVVLFDRSRTGATPTAALESELPNLRRIQGDIKAVSEALSATQMPLRGAIRIAGFRSAISTLLPRAISAFMAEHEDVRVSLAVVREAGSGVQGAVERGEADFGVTTIEPPDRLCSTYLGSDPYVLLRRAGTRFAPETEQLVLWNERCSEPVPEILRAQGWHARSRLDVDSDSAVLAMVAQGAGFTIMPALAAEPLPDGVERVALRGNFRRNVWICGLPATWFSRSGRALMSHVTRAALPFDLSGEHEPQRAADGNDVLGERGRYVGNP